MLEVIVAAIRMAGDAYATAAARRSPELVGLAHAAPAVAASSLPRSAAW